MTRPTKPTSITLRGRSIGGEQAGGAQPHDITPRRIAVALAATTVMAVSLGALDWYRRDAALGMTAGVLVLAAGASTPLLPD